MSDAAATALVDQLSVDEFDVGLWDRGKRQLPPAHRERLFPKPSMLGSR